MKKKVVYTFKAISKDGTVLAAKQANKMYMMLGGNLNLTELDEHTLYIELTRDNIELAESIEADLYKAADEYYRVYRIHKLIHEYEKI